MTSKTSLMPPYPALKKISSHFILALLGDRDQIASTTGVVRAVGRVDCHANDTCRLHPPDHKQVNSDGRWPTATTC